MIALLAGATRLDQYHLRWRSELLLSDIRALELRKSTYADARKVIDRWGNNVRETGGCRRDWCDVEFGLDDFVWHHSQFFYNHQLRTVYRWLGGRPAMILGSLRIRKDAVVGKDIAEYVEGPCDRDNTGDTSCLTVIGQIRTGHVWPFPLHPEYNFGGPSGCTNCVHGVITFTPYADSADVRRLTDLDFSCITRWHPCATQGDVLPAWKQLLAQQPAEALAQQEERTKPCSPTTIRLLGRGIGRIPLATVIYVDQSDKTTEVTIRMDAKPTARAFEAQPVYTFYEPQPGRVRLGDRVLAFGEGCLPPLASEENLRVAQQGVAENVSDHPDSSPLPFGDINPPHIKAH